MDRLHSYEYAQGYTAALQDVLSYFEHPKFLVDLKKHKRKQTLKELSEFIHCMIDNRTILREDPDAFIRCNNEAENGYELWYDKTSNDVIAPRHCLIKEYYENFINGRSSNYETRLTEAAEKERLNTRFVYKIKHEELQLFFRQIDTENNIAPSNILRADSYAYVSYIDKPYAKLDNFLAAIYYIGKDIEKQEFGLVGYYNVDLKDPDFAMLVIKDVITRSNNGKAYDYLYLTPWFDRPET